LKKYRFLPLKIDIDDTILISAKKKCKTCDSAQYFNVKPVQKEIDIINKLYDMGYTIFVHTARGWKDYRLTEIQLNAVGLKYHQLICGNVPGIVIDKDSLTSAADFLKIHVNKKT